MDNYITRRVRVNRARTPQEALDATGRMQHTASEVVDNMPKGEGDEVEVVFFKPDLSQRNGFISDDNLEKEFELRGLRPADPISVAAENHHCTHWKNIKGNWCFASFGSRWPVTCSVGVDYRVDCGWDDHWWFAGLRK